MSSDGVLVMLCFEPNQTTEIFLESAMKSLLDAGCIQDESYFYKKGQLLKNISIKKAAKIMANEGGVMDFSGFGMLITLSARPDQFENRKIWQIRLVVPDGALNPIQSGGLNRNDPKEKTIYRGEKFVHLAKAVWNAPGMKPLFGIGWDWYDHGDIQPEEYFNNVVAHPNSWWVNFYGSDLAEKLGIENLGFVRTTKGKWPMYKVERLRRGVLALSGPTPYLMDLHDSWHGKLEKIVEDWRAEEFVVKCIEDSCEELVKKGVITKYWDAGFHSFMLKEKRPWICLRYTGGGKNRYAEAEASLSGNRQLDESRIKALVSNLISVQLELDADEVKIRHWQTVLKKVRKNFEAWLARRK